MHACWFLLCASGEIAATILHVRPPRFVTKSRPLVSEVDIVDPQFPVVRVHRGCQMIGDETPVDLMAGIQKVGIIGDHPLMNQAMETAALLAPSDAPVLVLGETGTGKELFSKLIHVLSTRSVKPFVAVNCAAIPENLVESLLFGHKKGSFTGAIADHPGKFDEANGGTLFLDELGELPLSAQVKLLRVLNDGMVETIGEGKPHKVDVRIVCATHQNLPDLVAAGRFRSDLYYRLNVGEVSLPSLQDRRSDIPKLALSILDRINSNQKRKNKLSTSALKRLQQHTWSGFNFRSIG
jgi:transcriptional regulator with PAS, ATPase and Fis domain